MSESIEEKDYDKFGWLVPVTIVVGIVWASLNTESTNVYVSMDSTNKFYLMAALPATLLLLLVGFFANSKYRSLSEEQKEKSTLTRWAFLGIRLEYWGAFIPVLTLVFLVVINNYNADVKKIIASPQVGDRYGFDFRAIGRDSKKYRYGALKVTQTQAEKVTLAMGEWLYVEKSDGRGAVFGGSYEYSSETIELSKTQIKKYLETGVILSVNRDD